MKEIGINISLNILLLWNEIISLGEFNIHRKVHWHKQKIECRNAFANLIFIFIINQRFVECHPILVLPTPFFEYCLWLTSHAIFSNSRHQHLHKFVKWRWYEHFFIDKILFDLSQTFRSCFIFLHILSFFAPIFDFACFTQFFVFFPCAVRSFAYLQIELVSVVAFVYQILSCFLSSFHDIAFLMLSAFRALCHVSIFSCRYVCLPNEHISYRQQCSTSGICNDTFRFFAQLGYCILCRSTWRRKNRSQLKLCCRTWNTK